MNGSSTSESKRQRIQRANHTEKTKIKTYINRFTKQNKNTHKNRSIIRTSVHCVCDRGGKEADRTRQSKREKHQDDAFKDLPSSWIVYIVFRTPSRHFQFRKTPFTPQHTHTSTPGLHFD